MRNAQRASSNIFVYNNLSLLVSGKQMHPISISTRLDSTRLSNLHFNLIFSIPRNVNKNAADDAVESLADVANFLAQQLIRTKRAGRSTTLGLCLLVSCVLFVCLQFFLGALLIESCICMSNSSDNSIKEIAAVNFNFKFNSWPEL